MLIVFVGLSMAVAAGMSAESSAGEVILSVTVVERADDTGKERVLRNQSRCGRTGNCGSTIAWRSESRIAVTIRSNGRSILLVSAIEETSQTPT
ncbi:MAG: hypothetical protein IAG10_09655, partial [Planctomycetaceae bacterium]|nr:hypothetical protein [Planctomycetaceae bacterium]